MLSEWINDVLQEMRIVVRDIAEDLYDGHILALFVGRNFSISLYCIHFFAFQWN